ncbi:MAG: MBL fold metallo-hydrolase [Acidobacteriota bacterium]|nr:MBL fold metallo-hydrolase [Acidobacteriota bacterium]
MITLLPAGNPGPFTGPRGNNTWLVDGASPLLVDAGVGADAHIAQLRAALGGRPLARVFVTHGHHDHAAGAPRLRAEWPGLEVWSLSGSDGATRRAEPGARLPAGDGELEVIASPGHARDHACLWEARARLLFSGDLIVSGSSVMISTSSGGNLRQYLASLAAAKALGPARVYPGHGPIIEDAGRLIDEYVSHRALRERQIMGAIDAGPATIDALTREIYPGLDPALEGAARETLLAHLRKLEEEQRVCERNGRWLGAAAG